jgi:cytochrome c oxidase cbb3-type subunit I/II
MNTYPNTGGSSSASVEVFRYDDAIVRKFLLATILWGVVGMLFGVIIAWQLADWRLNGNLPWISFGRLRPLHTNAAIFAFAGNAIFAGIYYSTQRLLKARMLSDTLSAIHFWGWQLIIVGAALTLPFGITQAKEYAELEWPLDIAIAAIWVVFAVNFMGTMLKRREKHIYVAVWFYIATIVTVAMLHIFNSLSVPVGLLKSYSIYAGIQDALVQWWYGHNAVAFFLTTPFLGLMYYYLPKAAGRPVYSYRLSIVHFWSLVFIYIWAGPHHLLNTALPEWAQTLGMIFSLMLWAPSWGGMINGLLTLRGAWDKVRAEPILKFFAAGVTFYGMSTFEGPLLSIKSVSSLAHYTDWIIGHVHGGTLGWNGFITFGMIYWLVPKLWGRELYSKSLANTHFWLGTVAIVLYMMSMWAAGITQGLMWRAMEGSRLVYPDFVETVLRIVPLYYVRAIGGTIYLVGVFVMVYNVARTIAGVKAPADTEARASALPRVDMGWFSGSLHRILESLPITFTVLTTISVAIGGIVQITPVMIAPAHNDAFAYVKPYSPLELAGRDVYLKEGCYTCHSQAIRALKFDVARYGDYSRAEESMYDRPFQWGSRRIGPDLARISGKYPDLWHYRHMIDPRVVTPKSIMPSYPWLARTNVDMTTLRKKLSVMRMLGVPYSMEQVDNAENDALSQAKHIAQGLRAEGVNDDNLEQREITALIAYLQRLGLDYRKHTAGRGKN